MDAINRIARSTRLFSLPFFYTEIRVHRRRKFSDVVMCTSRENASEWSTPRESGRALLCPTQKSYARQVFLSEGTSTRQTCRKKARAFSPSTCISASSAGVDMSPFLSPRKCIMSPIRPSCNNNNAAHNYSVTLSSVLIISYVENVHVCPKMIT